jgi:hypothetical protein
MALTAKDLDAGDRHLRKSITYKVVQIMRRGRNSAK